MKMKSNLKVKNINTVTVKAQKGGRSLAEKVLENIPAVVSFVMISKIKLCFRECANIVKIAEDTGCLVEIASGTKEGTSESILSLVNLAVTSGQSLVLKIHGKNNREAFNQISKVLSGESSVES